MTVKFIVGGVLYDIVFIIVENDLNCDGVLNGLDLLQFKKIQKNQVFGAFNEYAADVNNDGILTEQDGILLTDLIMAQN